MRPDKSEQLDGLEGTSYRELRLLQEVESTPEASQRHLAHQLGIALGVANFLVRSLARKGYIRASQVTWRRWLYILTPAGVARKVHLTLAYIERVMNHYRHVRTLVREDLGALTMNAESHVAIYGTTELAELVYLALRDMGVTRISFFDRQDWNRSFLGTPVQSLESIATGDYVKVMVAFSADVEARCQELYASGVSPSRIVTLLQNSKREGGSANRREEV